MPSHGRGYAGLVVGTVGNEAGKGLLDLVQQSTDLRSVIDVVVGQGRRHDPTARRIQPNVQLLPGALALDPVLFDQPLARTAQLDARAVHLRWPPKLRQVAMRKSCFYKRLRNRSSQ